LARQSISSLAEASARRLKRNPPDRFSFARDSEPGRHFRVRFERFQWLAAPFSIL
jgi:hypothetical protein